MNLKISRTASLQYILIYFMLILNQSNLYKHFLSKYNIVLMIIVVVIMLINRKYRNRFVLGFVAFLLADVIFTRMLIGGVGLSAWNNWIIKIGFCFFAIQIDTSKFLDRFIRVVTFLAVCSLIGYFLGAFFPAIFKSGLFTQFQTLFVSERTWTSQSSYMAKYYNAYGLLLYTFTEHETMRNIGIFTEPGIYQMVLNASLAIMLFYGEKVCFKNKKNRMRVLFILVITLITCQSTTGYIGFAVMIMVYVFTRNHDNMHIKKKILLAVSTIIVIMAIDYLQRGTDSFLGMTVIRKLVDNSGNLSLTADTGAYRWGMILLALQTMFTNPLGVGYDSFRGLANVGETGLVAAQIVQTGAVYGLPMFIGMLWWIIYPIIKYESRVKQRFIIIFLYFNTALAQSSEYYPVLIMFGILFYCWNKNNLTRCVYKEDSYYQSVGKVEG